MNYRYTLEPYRGVKSRFTCPQCRHPRRCFVRYIDSHTGQYVDANVGRCGRQDSCGYHYKPGQFFEQHGRPNTTVQPPRILPPLPASYIPFEDMVDSFRHYVDNNFARYLYDTFGMAVTRDLLKRYLIGTSDKWKGASIFWQLDGKENVRSGKIMLYDHHTGKRVKEPYNHIAWVHALKDEHGRPVYPSFHLKQCFFGEHLLTLEPDKQVAIVESEKTAIIASAFMPRFIWLATGSKDGLNKEKCKVLQDRLVHLYPDLGAYDDWRMKGDKLLKRFTISDILERNATEYERRDGWDVADYFLTYPLRP